MRGEVRRYLDVCPNGKKLKTSCFCHTRRFLVDHLKERVAEMYLGVNVIDIIFNEVLDSDSQ